MFAIYEDIIHVKTGGKYVVVGYGKIESTLEEVCIYGKSSDPMSKLWVRPVSEMHDGRFIIDEGDSN